jgi:hypothetical protein
MKKYGIIFLAALLVVAFTAPAFAVEFKYGGLYRLRWQGNNNVRDGKDTDSTVFLPPNERGEDPRDWTVDTDDNAQWIDQRLRMYFTFIASERLQLVTKWEVDTQWGNARSGGDVGADSVNFEMKNVYADFYIPHTPTRARLGVQGIAAVNGWVVDDDFSAARLTTPINPVTIDLGYIGARNEDVNDYSDRIDDWWIGLQYDGGPFSAGLLFFYQYAHDTGTSTIYTQSETQSLYRWLGLTPTELEYEDNSLMDIAIQLKYDGPWFAAYVNAVFNTGSYDVYGDELLIPIIPLDDRQGPQQPQPPVEPVPINVKREIDYKGWMVDAGANFFYQNFTFTLTGFYTSGTDAEDYLRDHDSNQFAYPAGASHYWAEIMGLGTLDVNVGGTGASDRNLYTGGYTAADSPSNLWTINAGFAWQALPTTKFTFNYWYIQASKNVFSDLVYGPEGDLIYAATSKDIGNEIDFYIDQDVVDGLKLRIVGAYLFAGDAYTYLPDDDNAWEAGARLQWAF